MTARPTILCPVDFSDASRGSLKYARLIAGHFDARMVILAVEDPLLTEAIDLGTGHLWDPEDTRSELARFVGRALGDRQPKDLEYEVAVGKPARQILQIAQEKPCDLIVMGTHGLTGMRKMFFGSTTERVLRETTIPVLATPPSMDAPGSIEEVGAAIGRILVPVDLSSASIHQVQVGRALSEALKIPLVATYVVEPVRSPLASKLHLPSIELERKTRAEDALNELLATVPRGLHPEALVAYGDPAEEIAKVARDRLAGLIVIGLHGSPLLGPRMGSVTYRVLCLTSALVLALPPRVAAETDTTNPETRSFVHK
jgi:nucleotide-binding universal stress UspA family protein